MEEQELREYTFDIFQEIGNVGNGSAVTALSHILDTGINGKLPFVMQLDSNRLLERLGKEQENVMAVLFPFYGDISGMLLFIFKESFVSCLLKKIMDREAGFKSMDEQRLSVIKETANIMASSYFTAISSYTNKKIFISLPAVTVDMLGAVVTDPVSGITGIGENTVCIESGFSVEGSDDVNHLGLMMYQESTLDFLRALGGDL